MGEYDLNSKFPLNKSQGRVLLNFLRDLSSQRPRVPGIGKPITLDTFTPRELITKLYEKNALSPPPESKSFELLSLNSKIRIVREVEQIVTDEDPTSALAILLVQERRNQNRLLRIIYDSKIDGSDYVRMTSSKSEHYPRELANNELKASIEFFNVLNRIFQDKENLGDGIGLEIAKSKSSGSAYSELVVQKLEDLQGKLTVDKKTELLLDRAEANATKSLEPLKKYFSVMRYLEIFEPEEYKKFVSLVKTIMEKGIIDYQKVIDRKGGDTAQDSFEAVKDAKSADFSYKASVAIMIAETFFNTPDRVNESLGRNKLDGTPIIGAFMSLSTKYQASLRVVLSNDVDGANDNSLEGLYNTGYNIVIVEDHWEKLLSFQELNPFDSESKEYLYATLLHEVTTSFDCAKMSLGDGMFNDWTDKQKEEFKEIRRLDFEKSEDKSLSYLERYSGMNEYAFVKSDVLQDDGNLYKVADNYLSEAIEHFRYTPARLEKYNPDLYAFLVKDLGYDPLEVLTRLRDHDLQAQLEVGS